MVTQTMISLSQTTKTLIQELEVATSTATTKKSPSHSLITAVATSLSLLHQALVTITTCSRHNSPNNSIFYIMKSSLIIRTTPFSAVWAPPIISTLDQSNTTCITMMHTCTWTRFTYLEMVLVWELELITIIGSAWCMKVQKISSITCKELISMEIQ